MSEYGICVLCKHYICLYDDYYYCEIHDDRVADIFEFENSLTGGINSCGDYISKYR